MRRLSIAWLSAVWLCACGKSHPSTVSEAPEPPGSASGGAITAEVAPAPSAPRSSEWIGSYASVPGTLHLPPQWKNVKWSVPEMDAGLGGGTMSMSVDGSGRVHGAIEGPLGPARIDGYAADGRVTATVSRKDPADRGFEGTLEGLLTGAGADGTMNVALAEASAIRTATFKLAPGGSTPSR